jgi:hypothetical protein
MTEIDRDFVAQEIESLRDCQSASNVDPGSARNFDPRVAAASERAIAAL